MWSDLGKRASALLTDTHCFAPNRARGAQGAGCGARGVEARELARGDDGRTLGEASDVLEHGYPGVWRSTHWCRCDDRPYGLRDEGGILLDG